MTIENMESNTRTAFAERKATIDKLNECINVVNELSKPTQDIVDSIATHDNEINNLKNADTNFTSKITAIETKNIQQDADINNLKNADTNFTSKITAIETKNTQQDADINNLKNGDTNIGGIKEFVETIRGRVTNVLYAEYSGDLPSGKYRQFAKIPAENPNTMIVLDVMTSANGANYGHGRIIIGNPTTTSWYCKWIYREAYGVNGVDDATDIQIARETATGDLMIFARNPTITGLTINLVYSKYGSNIQDKSRVEKVANTTDYALDGTDMGIENIIPGSDANNVKINKINEYAVGITGNQIVSGEKTFVNNIIRKVNHSGGTTPENYATNLFDCYLMGNDSKMIVSLGHEKSNTADNTRIVFSLFANTNNETGKQPSVQLHFIFDNINNKFTMRPAHIDENGVKSFGNGIDLMTW